MILGNRKKSEEIEAHLPELMEETLNRLISLNDNMETILNLTTENHPVFFAPMDHHKTDEKPKLSG